MWLWVEAECEKLMWTAVYVQSNSFVIFLQTAPDSKWSPSWLKVDLWSSLAPSQPMSRCHLSSVKTTEENMKASQTPKHRTSVYHTYRHAVKLRKMITGEQLLYLMLLVHAKSNLPGIYALLWHRFSLWKNLELGEAWILCGSPLCWHGCCSSISTRSWCQHRQIYCSFPSVIKSCCGACIVMYVMSLTPCTCVVFTAFGGPHGRLGTFCPYADGDSC